MEAPESIEEMRAFCNAAPNTPKMANMIEGGKTPILPPAELDRLGFKLAFYSVTLLSSAVAAMNRALADLKACRPVAGLLPFTELCAEVGFGEYYVDDERYDIDDKQQALRPPSRHRDAHPHPQPPLPAHTQPSLPRSIPFHPAPVPRPHLPSSDHAGVLTRARRRRCCRARRRAAGWSSATVTPARRPRARAGRRRRPRPRRSDSDEPPPPPSPGRLAGDEGRVHLTSAGDAAPPHQS